MHMVLVCILSSTIGADTVSTNKTQELRLRYSKSGGFILFKVTLKNMAVLLSKASECCIYRHIALCLARSKRSDI